MELGGSVGAREGGRQQGLVHVVAVVGGVVVRGEPVLVAELGGVSASSLPLT